MILFLCILNNSVRFFDLLTYDPRGNLVKEIKNEKINFQKEDEL